jgi:PAS domain S-box-containing protein
MRAWDTATDGGAVDEDRRLAALRAYKVLDTLEEPAFDEIAQAVARLCGAPMAAVSLVDEARQWFKARVGLGVRETSRDVSFCAKAMLGDAVYQVPDAASDPRFADNALVTGEPHVRFYAGAPIKSPEGAPLGALCVIDTRARPGGLNSDQAMMLDLLARQVEAQLRLRLVVERQADAAHTQAEQIAAAARREERLISALGSAEVGWWDWEVQSDRVYGNADMARLFGVSEEGLRDGLPREVFFVNIHPGDRGWLRETVQEAVATGAPFRADYRVVRPDGESWVSARGQCLFNDRGEPWRFPGVAIDITDKKVTEQQLRDSDAARELALNAAQLGRFDHSPLTGQRFYDARALQMVGMSADEIQDMEAVLNHVHPEDRDRMREALARAVDPERSGPLRETYRIVRPHTGEQRWLRVVGKSHFRDGQCVRFMGVFEDVTEAKQAEEHRRFLTNELNHRMKNTLAITLSLVDNSLRAATDAASAREDIGGRIQALGRANDLLTADNWAAASVTQIVADLVRALSLPKRRVDLDGPAVRLGPTAALQLSMALHELATNALKYGAMANDTGRIAMRWGLEAHDDGQRFRFSWTETEGPPVEPPTRTGFGSRLIQRATAAAFSGDVSLEYRPEGVVWTLTAPYAGLSDLGRADNSEAGA